MQRCRLIIGFVLVLVSLGFVQGPLTAAQASEGDPSLDRFLYLPLVTAKLALSDIPPVIPETTTVLDDPALQTLESVSDEGTFTFSEPSLLQELQPNDVMVGESSPAAPYGFLRRVEAVSTHNGQMLVETGAATLEDAIQDGTLRVSQALSPAQVVEAQLAEGVRLERHPASPEAEFFVTLNDVVLYDHDGDPATADQITADGSLTLAPRVNLHIGLHDARIQNLSFSTTLEETADLRIKASVPLVSLQRQVEVARYQLNPITVYVGVVPVVLVPVITIEIGVDGEIITGVTASVAQRATFTAGLGYHDDAWHPIGQTTNDFSHQLPTPYTSLKAEGYAGPQLSLLLYGVSGPYADTRAFLELEANPVETPWWKLYGGLEVTSGVRMDLLSLHIESPELPVIGVRQVLRSASDQNLVTNGSFEHDVNGWSIIFPTLRHTMTNFRSGPGAAELVIPNGRDWTMVRHCIVLPDDVRQIHAIVHAKPTAGNPRAGATFALYRTPTCNGPSDSVGALLYVVPEAIPRENGWTAFSTAILSTDPRFEEAGAVAIDAYIRGNAGDTAVFDDISLTMDR